jgi:outer membrane protein OmpA-like peptidoglycan-associated protein
MSFFKNAPHLNGTRRQQPAFPPGSPPDASSLRLAFPAAAVVVTLGLFGYALSSGTAGDQAPVQSPVSAAYTGELSPGAGWIKNFIAFSSVFGKGTPTDRQGASGEFYAAPPPADSLPQFAAAGVMLSGTADGRLALIAPPAPRAGLAAADLRCEAAINSLSIEFPGNSAKISAANMGTVKKAAELIKALPAGAEVDVIGYTAGSSHRASVLAQRRANSVYKALVRAGVHPSMLRPKGLNASRLEANAKSATEGRSSTETGAPQSRDRRVEFHVVAPQR